MSSIQAIAAVTTGLRQLLQAPVELAVPGARVSHDHPDRVSRASQACGVNLFLLAATPDTGHRERELVTRGPTGALVRSPTLALDLRYLLSFHGVDAELAPQLLLAQVLSVLTRTPALSADELVASAASGPSGVRGARLVEQDQPVEIHPVPADPEVLARTWSTLTTAPYALSLLLQVGPVVVGVPDLPDASPAPRPG